MKYMNTALRHRTRFHSMALLLSTVMMSQAFAMAGMLQYQARLTDPDTGAPREGAFTMTFRIYDVPMGGTALWTEIKDITVENGLFSTLLGDSEPLPTPLFDGNDRWLGVKVGADGEAEPRQQIVPVAYALHTANALHLDGTPAADYAQKTEVFSLVATEAGPGSGLNADLLDGLNAIDFAPAGHNHDSDYVNKVGPDSITGSSANALLSVEQSGVGAGGKFTSPNSHGIIGVTESNASTYAGVLGQAGDPETAIIGKHGVRGETDSGKGVVGVSATGSGVYGWSTSAEAVKGETFNASGIGVSGTNHASSGEAVGVLGTSHATSGTGVRGVALSTSGATYGVLGRSESTSLGAGVRGEGKYTGLWATTSSAPGANWAVYGAAASGGYSVYGGSAGATGYAGYFVGRAAVTGTLTKGSGSFKIDHPLDPQNKYLYHSFVESPDMMNVYNGTVALDAEGTAQVALPDYFEVLNRDFRYQLTAVGAPAPNLHIASEVSENRFEIAGGTPGLKVSWQVTGIRQDPFALANPISVEVTKPESERGTYLHPEAYGVGEEKGLALITGPETTR